MNTEQPFRSFLTSLIDASAFHRRAKVISGFELVGCLSVISQLVTDPRPGRLWNLWRVDR